MNARCHMKPTWKIVTILLLCSILTYCQNSKNYFENGKKLQKKADSLRLYKVGNYSGLYEEALSNYNKEIETHQQNYDAYYFAGETSKIIERLKNMQAPNPEPTYSYYLKLYQIIIQNPTKQISSEFPNRAILIELSSLFYRSDLQKSIFYLEEALKFPYHGKGMAYKDDELYKNLAIHCSDYGNDRKYINQFSTAYFYYGKSIDYYNKYFKTSKDKNIVHLWKSNFRSVSIDYNICKFLANNPRWEPITFEDVQLGMNLGKKPFVDVGYLITYDPKTLKFSNNIISAWVREINVDESIKTKYYEVKYLLNFNLTTNKYQMSKFYAYNKNGNIIKSSELENAKWESLVPDELYEIIFNFLKKIRR